MAARVALLALLLVVALAPGAGAEPVRVRAADHGDYGRIVFNWDFPVQYEAAIRDGRLQVSFARPIEADYGQVRRALSGYLADVRPGGDGRSVSFGLRGDYRLRRFTMGAAVVLDLMGAAQEAATSPGTEAGPPALNVRVGEHDDFSRIVFDWPKEVDYGVAETAKGVTVVFARPARARLQALTADPPRWVRGASADLKDGGKRLAVEIRTAPNAGVRHFLSGPKVVVDILKPDPARAKAEAEPEPEPEPAPEPEPQSQPQSQPETEKAPAQPESQAADAPTGVEPVGERLTMPGQEPAEPGRPRALQPPERPADGAAAPDLPAQPVAPVEKQKQPAPKGPIKAVTLRFDWNEPVAAAMFERAGWLWVVFDKAVTFDPGAIEGAGGNAIREVEQVPSEKATILRLKTVAGVEASPGRDGLAWLLRLRKQTAVPENPIEANAQPNSPIGARLFLPVAEPGRAVGVTDPTVGDNLVVVPVIPLGYGVAEERVYPQLRLLPSVQGVVISPRVDELRVRPLRQGVEITSEGQLQISSVSESAAAGTKLSSKRELSKVFDLEKWRRGSVGTFNDYRQNFLRQVSLSEGDARQKARRQLAQFFFSAGFAAETLAVLDVMQAEQPELAEQPWLHAVRGASNFLLARYPEARRDLAHESLDGNDEAAFWRAAAQAAEGDLEGAAEPLMRNGSLIRSYPKALMMPLGQLVARAAISVGDDEQALHYLEVLKLEEPTPRQALRIKYVAGRLKELQGEFDEAVKLWEEAMDGDDRWVRSRAARARAELLYKLDKISLAEMLDELEDLRFAWRGDEFEFTLLRRLGSLYLEHGQYREGLRTLRQAATHFRSHPQAPEVTQQMADAFAALYLEGKADDLPPVTAIALYDEFKELTPAGPRGDEMIRKLADRLVSVDLLDRAAELLESQVNYRLRGVERARVGAQLALVHLLNREPQKAMDVLKKTDRGDLPGPLATQRRHLQARVLMQMDRGEEALTLLKDDESMNANLLRAEIYWDARNWPRAAQTLARLVRAVNAKPTAELDRQQARYVLDLAVALTLAGNERAVARLRSEFGPAMDRTPYKEAFRLIASPQTDRLVTYQEISRKVAEAENFQGFMEGYRDRVEKGGLSAIN